MKRSLFSTLAIASTLGAAHGNLFFIQDEAQESLPLKWSVGANLTYDDNVNPTAGILGQDDDTFSINPYVGLSFVNITPQTTLDVYARLGGIYYFDEPTAIGSEDFYTQSRLGLNWTHRVSEKLRFSSRNFLSYELEPDYAYGFATSRQLGEYFFWQTDNSVGYRWTERFATYTGFTLTGLDYDDVVQNQDRFTWSLYNDFRYQLTEQTVLTATYRYSQTDGDGLAADYTDHFVLAGVEHRFSPTTILVVRAGAQFHETDTLGGANTTSPYLETTVRSQMNEQFELRAFARYGVEGYDTIRTVGLGIYEFDERETLRIGVAGDYAISPMFSVFGGLDYIPATFDGGRLVAAAGPAPFTAGGFDEDVFNAYIGLSVKFNEMLTGTFSYNYTDSSSDFAGQSYDRNRLNLGIRADF
jgi:hypothetical protein